MYLRRAQKCIPAKLEELEENPTHSNLHTVFGLMMGILSCFTGHRTGVFENLTVEAVSTAQKCAVGERLRVEEHKTSAVFGSAQIVLAREEYRLFSRLIH